VEYATDLIFYYSELRNSLLNLNTLSNNTTMRLDTTYYSILEKLSVLQNTISSMKELAGMTKNLNNEFKEEGEEVISEVRRQLNAFEGFDHQEKRISALQARVQKGRDQIRVLGKRVEVVGTRVEGWEKAQFEWQERTRKRLRYLWVIISIFPVIFIASVVFQNSPTKPNGDGVLNTTNGSNLGGKIPDFEQIQNESIALKQRTKETLDGLQNMDGGIAEEAPRLKIFDEL
jgi:hypothetical protein